MNESRINHQRVLSLYKSMKYVNLLVLHNVHDPITSLKPAIALAKDIRANLEIRVLNQALPFGTIISMQNPNYDWSKNITDTFDDTEKRVEEIQSWIKGFEVDALVTSSCQQLALVDDEVSSHALYADLVICHRCEQSLVSGLMSKALEGAIFDAGKPALILTQRSDASGNEFKSISIAWEAVPEAMKALTASLPLLKRAVDVNVVVVTTDQDSTNTDSNSKRVLDWLKNHEIDANLEYIPQGSRSVSDALIDHINKSDRDLFVMGAYGHSKLSERLLSGVSHTVLEKSNKSLFIAH